MNFIELKLENGSSVLINLSTVTCVMPKPDGTALFCFDGEETLAPPGVMYDDILSTIETMQRRNGR